MILFQRPFISMSYNIVRQLTGIRRMPEMPLPETTCYNFDSRAIDKIWHQIYRIYCEAILWCKVTIQRILK